MDEHLSASGSQPELETKSVQPLCKAVPGNAGTNALFNFFIDQENKFLEEDSRIGTVESGWIASDTKSPTRPRQQVMQAL